MTDMDVARIGRCAGCEKTARLESELCADCLPRYGPEMGLLFRKVREVPEFAQRCYSDLSSGPYKEMFVRLFGDPFKERLG